MHKDEKKQHPNTAQLCRPLCGIKKQNKASARLMGTSEPQASLVRASLRTLESPEVAYFCWHHFPLKAVYKYRAIDIS